MDETDDSGGFPLSPIEEFERKENVELREQIANLNWKNHHEYFDGIRRIAAGLDAKIMVYEENIHFARMKLPEELKKLQDLKTQLAEMREQLVDNARIYGEAREAILGRMEKECPDVLAKIKIIMGKRIEYWTLLFHKKLRDLSDEVLISLESQDYEQLIKKHVQLVMLTRDEAFIYCSEDQVAEFDDQVEDKLVSLNSKVYSELTKEFQTVTERIRFPFETSVDFAFVQPDLEKMAQMLDCLHEIKPRCGDDQSGFTILELLFGMFEKRFRFHFYGDRATNSPDKPQWFFTQVISWMGSNAQFFSDYVQRIMNKTNSEVFVRGEFQKRLVNLAIEKVETMLDSDAFLQRYVLFANLIDETVIFEADLNSFGYPQDFPRVFSLFCRRDIMNAWLRLERETTAKAIDSLIIQENAFQNRHREASDVDEYLTSDFVDSFVSMMQAMFHRYRHVPDLDVQAQFFKLQLMIFDEFRTRLVQILDQAKSPWTQPYPQILNALWYIAVILGEWSDLSEFIRIQNHIDSRKKIRGAFDESKKMYDHVWIQRVTALVNAFGQMISADIEEYGQQKWFAVTNQKPNDVTPSICSFLRRIRDLIGKISASISANSIKKVYEMTSRMVAIVLMDDIVAKTRFNWQGAAQMLYDIETCVIPLLKALYDRPNARLHHSFDIIYDFKWVELLNSLRLLALKEGTAILLKDEICKIPEEMVEEKLADLGIQSLTQQAVLDRFNQRCDMYDISAR
ncbi:hypothetical protein L596_010597 [Steinernema carpocapsae]|uniref:RAD50-interacting protein 1 n=1 Tax=Steinernema carpocapsae TaxID=34508 RepID=A0A4U5PJ08_STECR|nr:hypothetical protein L596_010597 [Steinernema carpocapsae]